MKKADIETVDAEDLNRIGEVADEFGVTLRTLRFYEDKGLIAPKRVGTSRFYGRRERARLRLILLGRDIGFSLEDIREMLDLYEPNTGNMAQLTMAIEKSEQQLQRLNEQRRSIDEAIARLQAAMDLVRARMVRIA
ncbi:MAG: MerR family DNA-binding transcriptional regulator [Phyllobacteriaceae bacterium]|nr:MerR family DNA-binding transcriptional regulator [Phyllobacteriaceae bacterium]